MGSLKLVSLFVLCMLVAAPLTAHAITCGQVTSGLAQCLSYLKGSGNISPSVPCCNGVRSINSAAKTTADRQLACQCLKDTASRMGSAINPTNAANLPKKCNVNIPYQISLSTNCKSVK